MLAIILLSIIGLAGLLAFGLQGAPYVASDGKSTDQMLKLIKSYSPERILDMGSGDGRLVISLAQQGCQVDGIELNPWLVVRSRRAIKRAGLQGKARVLWGSFWGYDVSGYNVITLYAVTHIMPRLERKLSAELPPGAHIISNYFVFPNLRPIKQLGQVRVYKV